MKVLSDVMLCLLVPHGRLVLIVVGKTHLPLGKPQPVIGPMGGLDHPAALSRQVPFSSRDISTFRNLPRLVCLIPLFWGPPTSTGAATVRFCCLCQSRDISQVIKRKRNPNQHSSTFVLFLPALLLLCLRYGNNDVFRPLHIQELLGKTW